MDCEHRDQLLDLVYGELEDAEASVLRRQAEACEGCRDELARLDEVKRLADQLVVEPMPLTAHNLIMAAAKEAAAKNGQAEAEPEKSWLAGVWTWIQETAAKPQLAMAVVMLGVVAVGIYFVPGDELAQQEIETSLVADPETETETETELDTDPEIETEVEAPEAETQQVDTDVPRLDEPAEDVQRDTRRIRPDPVPEVESNRARPTERTREPTSAEIAAARREGESAEIEQALDLADLQNSEGAVVHPFLEEGMENTAPATETRAQTRTEIATQMTRAPVQQQQSANTIEPMRGDRATYERAMSEYRGGDFRSAAQEFERVVRSPDDDVRQLLPSALHHLARSHRRRGACSTALQHFGRLFERYPAYAQLPQALLEAADCHRREGNLSQARTLLFRAEGYASTQAAAQRELQRIETIQRAQRRSAPAPAQADSIESAY